VNVLSLGERPSLVRLEQILAFRVGLTRGPMAFKRASRLVRFWRRVPP
jgi:hypothetical protein